MLACLQPGPTPMGPEVSDLDPPPDLMLYESELGMAVLSVSYWEEPTDLFTPTMLFCGDDRLKTGFKAEPIWSFDLSAAEEYEPYVTGAELVADLPPTVWIPEGSTEELEGDNPDLDKNITVKLMSFANWPDTETPLESLADLGLEDVLGGDPVGVNPDFNTEFRIPVPRETVQAWLQSSIDGDSLNLAFELPGTEDSGLLRLYSLNSLAPQDTVPAAARLEISYYIDEDKVETVECARNGQALSRDDPVGVGEITLATGLPRYTFITLQLPDSLRRDDLMVMRARLYLSPDPDAIEGMGVQDREPDGLTLRAVAPDEEFDTDTPVYPEEDYYGLASSVDLYDSYGDLLDSVYIPLTPWIQDWMEGDRENHGIILSLNGADERPRSLAFYLDEAGKEPRLEIIYARRPDFD